MGKIVPEWQTFIHCSNRCLTIRHLKNGLAEDLELPWPKKLEQLHCEKVRFRAEELRPLSRYGETLHTAVWKDCELEPGALSVLSDMPSLRCLSVEHCGVSDEAFRWFCGTPKLSVLSLAQNPDCTGAVAAQALGAPLVQLSLQGTGFQDSDIPLIQSFPTLRILNLSDTRVTGAALPQLAANRALTVICGHAREGVAQFRAAQRQLWKKKLPLDEQLAQEPLQLVKNFYAASQDRTRRRNGFVTRRYLDDCKACGYNGLDPMSFREPFTPPYQDYRVVDAEQVTRKKFYIYSERDDQFLTQYRCLVLQTEDGWKIDKSQRLLDGAWRFDRLD